MVKKKIVEEGNSKLKNLLKDIQKEHKGAVIMMGSDVKVKERISTGNSDIDEFMGGGIPRGLFTVAWGAKGCGKTSLAYSTIAQAQKKDIQCLFLDLEQTYDSERAEFFGVNTDKLVVAKFPKAEQGMDTIITLCKEKAVGLIVLDSIHSMSPTGEQETKTGKEKSTADDTQALLARKLSLFFRKAAHYVSVSDCAMLLIGQTRASIGTYGNIEQLTGGNALLHWSAFILKMRRGRGVDAPMHSYREDYVDDTGKARYRTVKEPCGFNLVLKVDKTKIKSKPEGSELQLPFYRESGFNKPEEINEIKDEGDENDDSRTTTSTE